MKRFQHFGKQFRCVIVRVVQRCKWLCSLWTSLTSDRRWQMNVITTRWNYEMEHKLVQFETFNKNLRLNKAHLKGCTYSLVCPSVCKSNNDIKLFSQVFHDWSHRLKLVCSVFAQSRANFVRHISFVNTNFRDLTKFAWQQGDIKC